MIGQWTPETELAKIGGGAYGEVFRVIDTQCRYNRPAVVKYLLSPTTNVYAQNDEYEAMRRLSRNKKHKHIVELFELTINEASRKRLGFVMEFCDGGTLMIANSTIVYSMRTVVFWAIQLFKAIRYLFYHRIMYRDIKPNKLYRIKKIRLVVSLNF